jgi:hypothetical protein
LRAGVMNYMSTSADLVALLDALPDVAGRSG